MRIASVMLGNGSLSDSPALSLKAVLRDVTAPALSVAVPKTVLGPGQVYTFDARDSTDHGSGINLDSATWSFYESGTEQHAYQVHAEPSDRAVRLA